MSILIKFILRNIRTNKVRTFLILVSIAVSTALFFASMAITNTVEKMFAEQIKMFYGGADIIIYPDQASKNSFVNSNKAKQCEGIEFAIGMLQSSAYYKNDKKDELIPLVIRAMNYEDLKKMKAYSTKDETSMEPFSGNKIIISKSFAEKNELLLGDIIELEIHNFRKKFRISAISEPRGFFTENSNNITMIAPINTISSIYGSKGSFSEVYVKLLDAERLDEVMASLSEKYKRYNIREIISKEELEYATSGLSVPFMLMTGVVMFMSVFIMYTSYKVIIAERLPIIGTFRSIGATRKSTDMILFFESITYGIIGGISGCLLGFAVLYGMTKVITFWGDGVSVKISFTFLQLLAAFLLALVLSVVSSIFPIMKAGKKSVKDIIFMTRMKVYTPKKWKGILGSLLLILAIIIPSHLHSSIAFFIGFLCMISVILSLVLLVPYITSFFLKLFEGIYSKIFGNEGVLAVKNLRQNRSVMNNISLLVIGISSIIMINTVSASVAREVVNVFNDMNFDIFLNVSNANRNTINMLRSVDGVESSYGIYEEYGLLTDRNNVRISYLQGIDSKKFLDYYSIDFGDDSGSKLDQLNNGRNILIGQALKEQLSIKEGDIVGIEMEKGMRGYKVIGFFDCLMQNGSYAIISEKYFKLDSGRGNYSSISIKTKEEPDIVVDRIKKKFARMYPYISTMEENEMRNQESNKLLFGIMQGFSIVAMIIGSFGVFNNYTISFMERKRNLAMYRSIGMSKKQMLKMFFIEALSGGIIGGVTGALAGFLLIFIIPSVIRFIIVDIPMYFPWSSIWIYILAGGLISIIASISPSLKSSKLSIIENIKFE